MPQERVHPLQASKLLPWTKLQRDIATIEWKDIDLTIKLAKRDTITSALREVIFGIIAVKSAVAVAAHLMPKAVVEGNCSRGLISMPIAIP